MVTNEKISDTSVESVENGQLITTRTLVFKIIESTDQIQAEINYAVAQKEASLAKVNIYQNQESDLKAKLQKISGAGLGMSQPI